MVIIRLNRGGSKKRPKYRITVADSRRWLGGKFLEIIGHYNPSPRGQEKKLVVDVEKAKEWIAKGAQPTERVRSLLHEAGMTRPAYKAPRIQPKKKAAPAPTEAKAE
ncbi:MAG TPA: 30S ribosomal protein S16 [Bdellovibrionales bacterium]|nr:30S ribosomal protein S16 [Bdellovibrionales bacterium]